jgi:hypothetical protein
MVLLAFFSPLAHLAFAGPAVYTTRAFGHPKASLGTPGGLANILIYMETTHAAGRLVEGATARAGR